MVAMYSILDTAKIVCYFGQLTSVTNDLSMGLMSVPSISKSYLQLTSLLMYCTIYNGCSLAVMMS